MIDRGEDIEKLAGLLSADEYGDVVAEMLVEILAVEQNRNIFIVKLQELANELKVIEQEITFTPMEEIVLDFVLSEKQPLTAGEVSDRMGVAHPSLRHRTHASSVLNSLVSKGALGKIKVLGNIKITPSYYFTSPEEAVMECLKMRSEEPARCSPVRIADEIGMPLAAVLELIGELLE